ncbi:MAG: hypothetical protein J6L66_00585, partial [Anaerotignum sp.]|nr:hypothetical protein [Anaerotignum sp.]
VAVATGIVVAHFYDLLVICVFLKFCVAWCCKLSMTLAEPFMSGTSCHENRRILTEKKHIFFV